MGRAFFLPVEIRHLARGLNFPTGGRPFRASLSRSIVFLYAEFERHAGAVYFGLGALSDRVTGV